MDKRRKDRNTINEKLTGSLFVLIVMILTFNYVNDESAIMAQNPSTLTQTIGTLLPLFWVILIAVFAVVTIYLAFGGK